MMFEYAEDLTVATDEEILDVWGGKPFVHYTEDEWLDALSGRDLIIDDDERAMFDALPDVITIYRGSQLPETAGYGWAWSTDPKVGFQFATHYNPTWAGSSYMTPIDGGGYMATGTIKKSLVSIFTNRRNESEIVLHPDVWDDINVATVEHTKL